MKKEPRESRATFDSVLSSSSNSSEVFDFFLFFLRALVLALAFLVAFSSYFLFQKVDAACTNYKRVGDLQSI